MPVHPYVGRAMLPHFHAVSSVEAPVCRQHSGHNTKYMTLQTVFMSQTDKWMHRKQQTYQYLAYHDVDTQWYYYQLGMHRGSCTGMHPCVLCLDSWQWTLWYDESCTMMSACMLDDMNFFTTFAVISVVLCDTMRAVILNENTFCT